MLVLVILPARRGSSRLLSSLPSFSLLLPLACLTLLLLALLLLALLRCSRTPIALLLLRLIDGLPLPGAPLHRTLDVALVLVICDPRLVDDT
jgi:hypothetical protein